MSASCGRRQMPEACSACLRQPSRVSHRQGLSRKLLRLIITTKVLSYSLAVEASTVRRSDGVVWSTVRRGMGAHDRLTCRFGDAVVGRKGSSCAALPAFVASSPPYRPAYLSLGGGGVVPCTRTQGCVPRTVRPSRLSPSSSLPSVQMLPSCPPRAPPSPLRPGSTVFRAPTALQSTSSSSETDGGMNGGGAGERYATTDWVNNLLTIPASVITHRILGHLMINTAWAAIVTLGYTFRHLSLADWHVSPLPHTLMSGALGLLLVFRTNAAYDRFWEGRKVWGNVINITRNLARTGSQALPRDQHVRFAQLLIAYATALRAHLRQTGMEELQGLLQEHEVDLVTNDPNPPARICMKLTRLISRHVEPTLMQRLYMEQLIGDLINCLGQCERILLTPVPPVYSHHTSRVLSVYCLTLPLVLVQQLQLFTAPVVGAICWGLFSIEEIGHVIEEPFSLENAQLPLERYTNKIRLDTQRMLQLDNESQADPLFETQRRRALDGLRVVQEVEEWKIRSLEGFERHMSTPGGAAHAPIRPPPRRSAMGMMEMLDRHVQQEREEEEPVSAPAPAHTSSAPSSLSSVASSSAASSRAPSEPQSVL